MLGQPVGKGSHVRRPMSTNIASAAPVITAVPRQPSAFSHFDLRHWGAVTLHAAPFDDSVPLFSPARGVPDGQEQTSHLGDELRRPYSVALMAAICLLGFVASEAMIYPSALATG